VLSLLALVMLLGSTGQYLFKKYPHLRDSVNLIDSDRIYPKVNINTATHEELVDIPYIGDYTAKNIIQRRLEIGWFTSLEQLKTIKGIKERNFQIFSKYLNISQHL